MIEELIVNDYKEEDHCCSELQQVELHWIMPFLDRPLCIHTTSWLTPEDQPLSIRRGGWFQFINSMVVMITIYQQWLRVANDA